jgi:acyl-CoA thioester hydrolase
VGNTFEFEIVVPSSAIDANGHVNNVEWVRWMQEAAERHFDAVGGGAILTASSATWVVRTHHVEYLRAAIVDDRIRVRTWVENFRRVTSLRKYEFTRAADETLLVRGETDWVFVDATTGRPKSIPDAMRAMLQPPDAGG